MKAFLLLVITWIISFPEIMTTCRSRPPGEPGERELRAAQGPRASAYVQAAQGDEFP